MVTHTLHIVTKTVSEANSSEHWSKKHKRHKQQQLLVRIAYSVSVKEVKLPCIVTMIRLAPRVLDDDNLQSAFKYVRDELSECIVPNARKTYINSHGRPQEIKGRVDTDPRIKWQYEQRKSPRMGIEVTIEY